MYFVVSKVNVYLNTKILLQQIIEVKESVVDIQETTNEQKVQQNTEEKPIDVQKPEKEEKRDKEKEEKREKEKEEKREKEERKEPSQEKTEENEMTGE